MVRGIFCFLLFAPTVRITNIYSCLRQAGAYVDYEDGVRRFPDVPRETPIHEISFYPNPVARKLTLMTVHGAVTPYLSVQTLSLPCPWWHLLMKLSCVIGVGFFGSLALAEARGRRLGLPLSLSLTADVG